MLTRTARTGCGRDKVIFACGPCRSVAPQGMRPQSPADRRIWPVPCRDARPRATNLRAGRSTAGNATHAEEDQPSRGTRTGCSAPLSCDELAIDPQRIVGRVARARTGYNAASQSLAAASTRDPPLCTRVVIGMPVGEGVPKDRSDRRCDVLSAGAFGRCRPGAAWFGGLIWACWRSVAGAQECAWGAGDPALVAVGGPAPLDGEDLVHVRGQQGVNHVGGFGAVEAGVERAPGRPGRRRSWTGQCDAAGGSRPAARLRRGRPGRPPSAAVVPEPRFPGCPAGGRMQRQPPRASRRLT